MLVSVVVPAYNAQEWVAQTLTSVLQQTYRSLEIILVDDGSTDHTVKNAQETLAESGIPWRILQQQNMGAAEARNAGWRAAQGEWIQFLDADDLLASDKINVQICKIVASEEVDVVYSDWQRLICNNGIWRREDLRTPEIRIDALADILSDRNFLQLGSLLFRKELVKLAGGFDRSHEPIEDVGLCLKIAIAGGHFKKAPSVGPLSYYRDLPRSFSKANQRRFVESCLRNAALAESHVRKTKDCSARTIDAIVDTYHFGARYFAGYDWGRFEEIVCKIENLRPRFVPRSSAGMSFLSRLFGYRSAERIASVYRTAKGCTKYPARSA